MADPNAAPRFSPRRFAVAASGTSRTVIEQRCEQVTVTGRPRLSSVASFVVLIASRAVNGAGPGRTNGTVRAGATVNTGEVTVSESASFVPVTEHV